MRKKLLVLTAALITAIALPAVFAALTYQQNIQVNGSTRYPHFLPPHTMRFSLYYPNGTLCPDSVGGTLSGGGINTVVVDPMYGHNAGWMPTCIVVHNDGNVPIEVDAVATNVNLPSDLDLTLFCGYYGTITGGYGANNAATEQPIQPGECYYMSLIALINPTSYDYMPDAPFSYSYTVEVTATEP